MDLGLEGRAALVTASSRGLGRSAAIALAREGANVVVTGRDTTSLNTTVDAIGALGVDVLGVPSDVTVPDVPGQLVAATVARFGRLDIVVANAGGPPRGRALEVTDEQLRSAVEANFLASARLAREALPHMRAGGWGRICCITSFAIVQAIVDLSLSNAARTALWAWAKTAASDLAADDPDITINLACPGLHATERILELGRAGASGNVASSSQPNRLGDPDDFGAVVAFLCSTHARFVNGAAVVVDGGASLAL